LAGGSYLDICFAFGVGVASFFINREILWPTMAAIDFVLQIGVPVHDLSKLEEISQGFAEFSKGRMKGCIMAVDGWVCRRRCPTKAESKNQICFRNRKGMFGLVVMAGFDHKCRFMI
jgi:hypothetical protein